ncbi:unnamed protein product [Effrenium voratum]|uniref:Uncharacterized protein n=1 Tax=Effrenium voratum TaxID=2562239 RepID=A0AA36IH27_9DINO|nr:unnamed protein product [Effrenium voratum]
MEDASGQAQGRVFLAEAVFQACLTYAHVSCVEVQGLLFGDVEEVDGSSWSRPDVTIWGMQNRLTANSGEFLELPAEELVFAQQEAEDLAKQVGRPTRVIGWAISRSRAESPNDEDLERQLHYQLVVDGHFVGLAVKPAQQKGAGLQSAMTAFRSVQQQADSSRLRQTPQVIVVPQCLLLPQDPVSHLSIEPLVTMLVEAWERQKKTTDDSERSPLCARASVRSFCRRFEGLSSLLQNEVLQLQSLAADLDHNAEVLSAVNQQMSSQDSPTWLPGRTPGAFRPEPLETRPHVQGGEASKSEEGAQGQSKRVRGPAVSAEAEIRWQDQPKANRGTQEHTSAPASSAGAIGAGKFLQKVDQSRRLAGGSAVHCDEASSTSTPSGALESRQCSRKPVRNTGLCAQRSGKATPPSLMMEPEDPAPENKTKPADAVTVVDVDLGSRPLLKRRRAIDTQAG